MNWEKCGSPSQLFYEGHMMTKPVAVAAGINRFFINKVKDIIAEIPKVNMDPLFMLKEQMKDRRCSL